MCSEVSIYDLTVASQVLEQGEQNDIFNDFFVMDVEEINTLYTYIGF